MDLATVDKLLTTTRSVRQRLDLKRPVEPEIIERCLEIAVQAPTGGNICRYHFIVVTEDEKKKAIGDWYRRSFAIAYPEQVLTERRKTHARDVASWVYLVEHLQDAPLLIIPCLDNRLEDDLSPQRLAAFYGNILPATWSLMLALRARGLGSAWTTLALRHEKEIAQLLQMPANITPAALLPVAYFTGEDFHPAQRVPARERTYWNSWGARR
jgi:nitroreductase